MGDLDILAGGSIVKLMGLQQFRGCRRIGLDDCGRITGLTSTNEVELSHSFGGCLGTATNLLLGNPPELSLRKNRDHYREPKRYTYIRRTQCGGQADLTRYAGYRRAARQQIRNNGRGDIIAVEGKGRYGIIAIFERHNEETRTIRRRKGYLGSGLVSMSE